MQKETEPLASNYVSANYDIKHVYKYLPTTTRKSMYMYKNVGTHLFL